MYKRKPKSKTADKLKSEFEDKISKAKKEIGALMEKLKGPELPKPTEEPPATEQA